MHVTMVKKRLSGGAPCRKCQQAEDLLRSRGLWSRIDEIVWADEDDPSSPGMQLGQKHQVKVAPFFIVRDDDGKELVYESSLKFIKERLGEEPVKAEVSAVEPGEVEEAARSLEGSHPSEILRWGLSRFGDRLALAFSGAEDVALIHLARAGGLPFSVFTLDTGRLHPETYRYIDTVRKRYGVEIAMVSPDRTTLEPFVRRKGLFSFYDDGHEECCGIRKVEPLRRVLSGFAAWATGQRRDQSPATRGAIPVCEIDRTFSGAGGPLVKLNPLAAWTSAEVWQLLRDEEIPWNPLHERGFVSIGCEPCTRAILPGEHERAGRWWWEENTKRECGLHIGNTRAPG